jgi:hypothetical protein
MTRPCTCDRCHSPIYTTDQCRLCWLYHHDPAYRAFWQSAACGLAPPPTCKHRGEAIDLVDCPTCTGRVQLKVFACLVHGQCTTETALAALACCKQCPDYKSG